MDRGFDLHSRLMAACQPGTLESEHRHFVPVPAEAQLMAQLAKAPIEIKQFVALEPAVARLRTQFSEAAAQRDDVLDAVLLLAFDAVLKNAPLQLTSQVFFKFTSGHGLASECISDAIL
jgi:hypothetical protein